MSEGRRARGAMAAAGLVDTALFADVMVALVSQVAIEAYHALAAPEAIRAAEGVALRVQRGSCNLGRELVVISVRHIRARGLMSVETRLDRCPATAVTSFWQESAIASRQMLLVLLTP